MAPVVKVRRLREGAQLPKYMSAGAAGLDLTASLDQEIVIAPGQRALVGTGCAIELPPGHEGQVRPRSGLAHKHGVTVLNAPGTVDEDYRGEVKVLLVNHGSDPFVVRDGERIAQLVDAALVRVELREATLAETERGSGGYGSTGHR